MTSLQLPLVGAKIVRKNTINENEDSKQVKEDQAFTTLGLGQKNLDQLKVKNNSQKVCNGQQAKNAEKTEIKNVRVGSILWRVTVALIFLAVGVAALAYSVVRGDDHNQRRDMFNPFYDQYSRDGTLTVVYVNRTIAVGSNSSADKSKQFIVDIVSMRWYQDDKNERLKHEFGKFGTTWRYTIYALKNFGFNVSNSAGKLNCVKDNALNYAHYVASFGLKGLKQKFKGKIELENEEPMELIQYEGRAVNATFSGQLIDTVDAYVDQSTGGLIRWEGTYKPGSDIVRTVFTTKDMTVAGPSADIFTDDQIFSSACTDPVSSNRTPGGFIVSW